MSLDVYLLAKKPIKKSGTGVFVRDNGKTRELTIEEVREKFPDAEVAPEEYETQYVYDANITHNLFTMADKAGIYYPLWRPEEKGWTHAKQLISPLEAGLEALKADPSAFRKLNPDNGWGDYDCLVEFAEGYLEACREWPDAEIEVSR